MKILLEPFPTMPAPFPRLLPQPVSVAFVLTELGFFFSKISRAEAPGNDFWWLKKKKPNSHGPKGEKMRWWWYCLIKLPNPGRGAVNELSENQRMTPKYRQCVS